MEWPDGTLGNFTVTDRDPSGAVNSYTITYGDPVNVYDADKTGVNLFASARR
ncbi:hypothetical protein [Arthrobacter globiformis]|uniref:hypothetical protein n=1 Tax=Arthrobacter globiformis TaxID=1665 RepID=UPI001551A65A|nr:hypothetical protein [Arthrobacter globiformis]